MFTFMHVPRQRSEVNFCHVGSRNGIQIIRLGYKHLFQLRHLTNPFVDFLVAPFLIEMAVSL